MNACLYWPLISSALKPTLSSKAALAPAGLAFFRELALRQLSTRVLLKAVQASGLDALAWPAAAAVRMSSSAVCVFTGGRLHGVRGEPGAAQIQRGSSSWR